MRKNDGILMGVGGQSAVLLPAMANRHGLIAGATGTGKTISLKVMAESFSDLGVPVFVADIKGDLSGMCQAGTATEKLSARLAQLGIRDFSYRSFPTRFWDVYGENGHPIRTTISAMGPQLLCRLLDLSPVQEGVLNIVFRVADDNGLLLIDLKDLRAMVAYVGNHNKDYINEYGNITQQSIGAIQRSLLLLEDAGGSILFGEPALDISDWICQDENGRGFINVLHCVKLFTEPLLYSTFLLYLLTELYEKLPEVGDLAKPKIVFFFDEAHLLFKDAPKALLQKIEQVIKLVRSKGVGIFFVTQNPNDLPESVLAQLGNRIQHALRAYTPSEQKAVRAASDAFRPNPAFDTAEAITELATGEGLCSFLDADGRPSIVERAMILPPQSAMGVIDNAARQTVIRASALYGKYDACVDRESAYETLREEQSNEQEQALADAKAAAKEKAAKETSVKKSAAHSGRKKKSAMEKATDSAMTSIGRELGKTLARGILGMLKD